MYGRPHLGQPPTQRQTVMATALWTPPTTRLGGKICRFRFSRYAEIMTQMELLDLRTMLFGRLPLDQLMSWRPTEMGMASSTPPTTLYGERRFLNRPHHQLAQLAS